MKRTLLLPQVTCSAGQALMAAISLLATVTVCGVSTPGSKSTPASLLTRCMPSANGLYKAEVIHRCGAWKTKESVELATLQWVARFNHQRLLEPIGYVPPAEFEANYYQTLEQQAMSA